MEYLLANYIGTTKMATSLVSNNGENTYKVLQLEEGLVLANCYLQKLQVTKL